MPRRHARQARDPPRAHALTHISTPELNFAVMLEGVSIYGVQVKGVSLFRIYRPVNWEFFRIYPPDFQGH